ncbi:MAG TPA: SO2930 family diheme c-type cytochrome [Saprospiraceae bacterium]|nr:SO2930 family diheme c-type cytochrome [Saprospiraceae bacterium]
MKRKFVISFLIIGFIVAACYNSEKEDTIIPGWFKERNEISAREYKILGKTKLSDYGFFQGELSKLMPLDNVLAYEVNSPLFSDYSFKKRFIYFPKGSRAYYSQDEVFDFTEGVILIKNFYYPNDFRKADGDKKILETRLLIRSGEEWTPLVYIWNEEQTEAYLEIIGDSVDINWKHYDGSIKSLNYRVPDNNQCRSCHMTDRKTKPLGISTRQINIPELRESNPIIVMETRGFIDLAYMDVNKYMVSYENEGASLEDRARSYLDSNCGTCHNNKGSAKTSGLFLDWFEDNFYRLGVNKAPIAAGKASGGRLYSILPGKPDESILLYRMESNDIEIMMPEIGRQIVHAEGVELIRAWIESMKSN